MRAIKNIITAVILLISASGINGQQARNFRTSVSEIKAGDDFNAIKKDWDDYYASRYKGRGSGYVQYMRWAEYTKLHLDNNGKIVNAQAKNWEEYYQYLGERKSNPSNSSVAAFLSSWQFVGPTGHTKSPTGYSGGIGRINCIARESGSVNHLFAGTPAGGLWETTSAGNSWTCLTNGLPSMGVSGIAVQPNNVFTIYILTGDGDGANTYSTGVLKSTNGGTTWLSTGLTFPPDSFCTTFKLIMDPNNYSILYAATTLGLYKTINAGTSWTKILTGTVTDIEIRPSNSNILYAVDTLFRRSTNGGASWTPITGGLPTTGYQRMAIGVSANAANYVYLLFGQPGNSMLKGTFRGFYVSANDGVNFTLKSNTPNILGYATNGLDSSAQSSYDLAIAVDQGDAAKLIIGGINCWTSADTGATWTNSSDWIEDTVPANYTHADIHALEYFSGTIFCGSDGGIYRSTDGGATWQDRSTGLGIMQFTRLGLYQRDSKLLIGGAQDNGANYMNGTSNLHVWGADGGEAAILPTDTNTIFYEAQNGDMRRSTDGGLTNNYIKPDTLDGAWVTPFEIDQSNPSRMYTGIKAYFRSTNSGTNWTALSGNTNNVITAIALTPANPNLMYAINGDTLIHKSWNISTASPVIFIYNLAVLKGAPMSDICISPKDTNYVCITFGGYNANKKVVYSTNGFATQLNAINGLPNVPVYCAVFHPTVKTLLFIGTDVGVFYRDLTWAAATNWEPFTNGMPAIPVRELEIDVQNNMLFAATFGRGIWKSSIPTQCITGYNLTAANATIAGEYYSASDSIASSQLVNYGNGTVVTYASGNYIHLKPGFETSNQTYFNAKIITCPAAAAPIQLVKLTGTYAGAMDKQVEDYLAEKEQVFKLEDFELYPNPAHTNINVSFTHERPAVVKIYITDMQGKIIQTLMDQTDLDKGVYQFSYDIQLLKAGYYVLCIATGDDLKTRKFSKL